ncbi:MAG: hypothetical protein QW057_01795 [Candidatus Bathyarchaeia archaeon]
MSEARYLPRRLGFDKLCDILVAYLNVGAEKEYVSVSEAAKRVDVDPKNLSRNNLFLKSWGFLEENPEAPGRYKLSGDAAAFTSAYRIDRQSPATKSLLQTFLARHEIVTGLVERIRRQGTGRGDLLVELPRAVGDLKADKVGVNAFLDMLSYAFELPEGPSPGPRAHPPATRLKVKAARPAPPKRSPVTVVPVAINLTVSPDTSVEKLRESVKAVLQAYDEYQAEKAAQG